MNPLVQKFQDRVNLLDAVQADTKGLWGVMSAQNMVEHLGGLIYATSKGTTGMSLVMPPEQAAKMKKRFFGSYYPFPKSVKMPGTKEETPTAPPHRYESFEEAISKLKAASQSFLKQYQDHPQQASMHGYFGDLTNEEWLDFHIKHIEHHLMQFGAIPHDEKIPQLEKLLYKISKQVQADTPAQWGKMNAHQMIEHLGLVFVLSTGKFNLKYEGSEEDAKRHWEGFQQSDNPWKDVFPPIAFDGGKPKSPRKATIEESKADLLKTFQKYLAYCEANPDAINMHFYMGDLTVDQWRQAHVKHLQHHARQFGMEV